MQTSTTSIGNQSAGLSPAKLGHLKQQAQDLEGVFLNTLMKEMFSSLHADQDAMGGGFGEETLEAEINVKVRGYLRCIRAVAPRMAEQGWGRIVNVSGLAARQTGSVVGSVRNAAVAAMAKNLADELGPSGVNVTVVHPGPTVTERTPPAGPERISIGRLVTADEVADVIAFLCSPRSVAINGDAIAVGGGARGAIHY